MTNQEPEDLSPEQKLELYKYGLNIELEDFKATLQKANQLEIEKYRATCLNNLEEWKAKLDKDLQSAIVLMGAVIALAQLALKAIMLANGGACIALLTFSGHIWISAESGGKEVAANLTGALLWFAFGVGAAVLATAVSYVSQALFTEIFDKAGKRRLLPGEIARGFAVLAGVAGIVFFFLGIFDVVAIFNTSADLEPVAS
jgi:hypothetical protein